MIYSLDNQQCLSIKSVDFKGHIVDPLTQTCVLYGQDAAAYLRLEKNIESRMHIIVPSGADVTLSITKTGESCNLKEPGVILINAGTGIQAKVLRGDILVIREGPMPPWYLPYSPQKFQDISKIISSYYADGFDRSGLVWQSASGSVVMYRHEGRMDYWTLGPEEWMSSSITYGGFEGPFSIGVSRIFYKLGLSEPVSLDFKMIRKNENLHSHPFRENTQIIEVYQFCKGRVVLLFLIDGKQNFLVLSSGDMVIVKPGATHMLVAAQAPYEHLCFQIPTVFQYGFYFKESISPELFGLDSDKCTHKAIQALEKGIF